jgi:hypothetical protein
MFDSTGSVVRDGMLAPTAARPCCRLSRVILNRMNFLSQIGSPGADPAGGSLEMQTPLFNLLQ